MAQKKGSGVDFLFKFAEVFNQAGAAARLAGNAGITSMQDQPVMTVDLKLGGDHLRSFSSTCSTFLPGANCVRLQTRKMCVSTAMVGQPKAVLSTTLAVLRPTPGSASSAALSSGTSPLCCFQQDAAGFDDVFRFAVKQADSLDIRFHPIHPQRQHRCGRIGHRIEFGCRFVDADIGGLRRKQSGNPATRTGELKCSSVVGWGSFSRSLVRIARRLALFMLRFPCHVRRGDRNGPGRLRLPLLATFIDEVFLPPASCREANKGGLAAA